MDNKKAAELAEKELKKEDEEKQIRLIKEAIKQTLEKIKTKEKERTNLNKEIKTLKQDIDNIRAGRLDLIAERQEKDEEAKRTSVIEVVKEIHHHYYHDRWYEPYRITYKWDSPYYPCDVGDIADLGGFNTVCDWITTVNCSVAKGAYAGTYQLDNGDCVTLT